MSLVQPWALVLLLALPAIAWLHRRRRPARPLLVPSLLPWLAFAVQRLPQRSRLQASALLLSHLLAALALALAAAGLRWKGQGGPAAFVLDATPSMGAGNRWNEARQALSRLAAAEGGPFTLILAADEPRILAHQALDPSDLLAALSDEQAQAPTDLRKAPPLPAAMDLARRLVPEGRRWLITDPGAGATLVDSPSERLWRIGRPAANRAVVAALTRRTPSGSELYLQVAGDAEGPLDLRVTAGDALLWEAGDGRALLALPSDPGSRLAILPLPGVAEAEALEVRLGGKDSLAADDSWPVLPTEGRLRVQLLGAPAALVTDLSSWPELQVTPLGRAQAAPAGQARLSLLVGRGGDQSLPPGPILRLGQPGASAEARRLVWTGLPTWLPATPPGDIFLRQAAVEGSPEEADLVLGRLGEDPVLWLSQREGRPILTLAADPLAPEHQGSRAWNRLLAWSMQTLIALTPQGQADPALGVWARAEESRMQGSAADDGVRPPLDQRLPFRPPLWRLAAGVFLLACFADLLLRQGGRPSARGSEASMPAGREQG